MVAAALAAPVALLGVSLGVSAASTPDGAGQAAGAKSAAAGQKLAQFEFKNALESKQLKFRKSKPPQTRKQRAILKQQALYKRRAPQR
jgi:hypothetical protein